MGYREDFLRNLALNYSWSRKNDVKTEDEDLRKRLVMNNYNLPGDEHTFSQASVGLDFLEGYSYIEANTYSEDAAHRKEQYRSVQTWGHAIGIGVLAAFVIPPLAPVAGLCTYLVIRYMYRNSPIRTFDTELDDLVREYAVRLKEAGFGKELKS